MKVEDLKVGTEYKIGNRHGEIRCLEPGADSIGTIEGIADKEELARHLETIKEMEKLR